MAELPKTIEEAIAQAQDCAKAALNDDYKLIQIELAVPEIGLQAQSIAQQFIPVLQELGFEPTVLFPDTGAAALAKRDWGSVPFRITDLGSSRSPIERNLVPEDTCFLVVNPSDVEVAQVEKLYNLAGDRPVIILIPTLENISVIGVGYAGRQLRERFLSKIESCYYLRPMEGAAISRFYPAPWQVWLKESETEFNVIAELADKPSSDTLQQILLRATTGESPEPEPVPKVEQKPGFLGKLQRFLKAGR